MAKFYHKNMLCILYHLKVVLNIPQLHSAMAAMAHVMKPPAFSGSRQVGSGRMKPYPCLAVEMAHAERLLHV